MLGGSTAVVSLERSFRLRLNSPSQVTPPRSIKTRFFIWLLMTLQSSRFSFPVTVSSLMSLNSPNSSIFSMIFTNRVPGSEQ